MRELYSTQLAFVVGVLILIVTAIFALIQSPETLSAPQRLSVEIPHPVEGREKCDACHGIKGTRPYPVKHLGWSNGSCVKCHLPALKTALTSSIDAPEDMNGRIPGITHPVKGWEDCVACHAVDSKLRPAPADHKDWTNAVCLDCHLPAIESP